MSQTSLIDSIVAGVLKQLGQGNAAPSQEREARNEGSRNNSCAVQIPDKVITADLLEALGGQKLVVNISQRAIVTPAAWDFIRDHGIELRRGEVASGVKPPFGMQVAANSASVRPQLIVVKNTEHVDQLWTDLKSAWRRELLGCPDDAAKLAIGELCRGGTSTIVILTQQTYRAACLANRHEKVKAVPIETVGDMKAAMKQLRVNTWCIDPTDKSWFELKTLFKAITPGP